MTRITSQMAATVVLLQHEDGASVAEGEEILYLESMKMEIPVKSPVAGVVTYHVAPGEAVTRGTLLASIAAR